MRKVLLSGALALIGLAAPAASVLAPAAASPAAAAAPSHAAASTAAGKPVPGLYHVPIIGKVTLPGVLGSLLGSAQRNGLRHATAVSSSNWAGYADTNDTFNSVSSSWTEPTVNCANTNSGLNGLLGLEQPARRPGRGVGLLGRPRRLQLDERGAARDGLGLRLGHARRTTPGTRCTRTRP